MANPFKKARRAGVKLRAAIDGVSGAGKTVTALRLAHCLKRAGLGKNIAVIDTENESSSLCAGDIYDGEPLEFESLNLKQFSPSMYKSSIEAAEDNGFDIVVIDSLSHAWVGESGALDLVDQKGGGFAGWKDVTKLQNDMVNKIIRSKANIICTMRSKSEYIVEKQTNKAGKEVSVPRKIGMAPIQRDGIEFEFSIYGTMDQSNQIKITKSRCAAMQNATAIQPGDSFWQPLIQWMNDAPPDAIHEEATVFSESSDETYNRLASEIEQSTTFTGHKAVGDKIKAEIDKLPKAAQDDLREKFQAKMQQLKSPLPATVSGS